jgi:trehalose/maltose transport system permease protein
MNHDLQQLLDKILLWLTMAILFYALVPFYWLLNSLPQLPMPTMLGSEKLMPGLLSSLLMAVVTTTATLGGGTLAGFTLSKLRFQAQNPPRSLLGALVLGPQMVALAGLYGVSTLGLPAISGMLLSYAIFVLPLTAWTLTTLLQGVPVELMQAAQVDGATPFQTCSLILLPVLTPLLLLTGLLAFINGWNQHLLFMTHEVAPGEVITATVVVAVPLILLTLLYRRQTKF